MLGKIKEERVDDNEPVPQCIIFPGGHKKQQQQPSNRRALSRTDKINPTDKRSDFTNIIFSKFVVQPSLTWCLLTPENYDTDSHADNLKCDNVQTIFTRKQVEFCFIWS